MKKQIRAFTLIEVIVAVTIFGIMMISIMMVYFTANDITSKSDRNRTMHENMKNIVLNISEDVMKNGIAGVPTSSTGCTSFDSTTIITKGDKFCSGSGINMKKYSLKKKDGGIGDNTFCSNFTKNHCYLVQDGEPLTNDLVTVSDVRFIVTNEKVKKVTMSITMRPAPRSGVKPSLIKRTKLVHQLTLSERKYNK